MVSGDVDSNALGFRAAGRDRELAASDLCLGVIEGLHDAVCVFIDVVAGDIRPHTCGIVGKNFVGDVGDVRVDLLLLLEVLHAIDNRGNKHGGEDQNDGFVCNARGIIRRAVCRGAGAVAST